jgi:hypothetical protein
MASVNHRDAFLQACFHAVDGSTDGREDLHRVGLGLGYDAHTSDTLGAELAADDLLTLHDPHAYQFTEKGRRHVLESLSPAPPPVQRHLEGSAGMVNTGERREIGTIRGNVTALAQSGQADVAQALERLTDAIAASPELTADQRGKALEILSELSSQACLPTEQRSKPVILQAGVKGLAMICGAAGGLAEVWTTWGPTITAFFK